MRLHRAALPCLCCLLAFGAAPLRADAPPDPLRLIPAWADVFVKVEQPRRLVESVTGLEVLRQLRELAPVRELYDSTNARRFYQLLAYFEKQLGARWPELLDRLAGGGAVVAAKLGKDPTLALLVVQGSDEALLRKLLQVGVTVLDQELARQDSKEHVEKGSYRGLETLRIGQGFHAAVASTVLLASNKEEALRRGLDLYLDRGKKGLAGSAAVAEARKLLPAEPLAWGWLNLETIQKTPQAKEVLTLPRNDVNLTVLFGGWLDVARRAPFLCAGLHRQPDGFLATLRMPRGREGMPAALAAHLPPRDLPGTPPLLMPKATLYSSSYYLDVSKFWEYRAQLLNAQQLKALEEFDKNSGKFLVGNRFSELLTKAGPYQRVVVASQAHPGYKTVPAQRIPAFAVVVGMRDPALGKAVEGILRAAALFAGAPVKLKLIEEKENGVQVVGYRFPDDGPYPEPDPNNTRFNYSPSFARVGDQFVASSTIELCHELVGLLQLEAKDPAQKRNPASVRSRLFAVGGAEALEAARDQVLAQTILGQALSPSEAGRQVRAYIDLVRRLGVLQNEVHYGEHDFRYDVRWLLEAGQPSLQGK
jgi:hypothetical protein